MTVFAAVIVLFGILVSWLLWKKSPQARFTRIGYGFITLGGVLALIWGPTHALPVGILALAVLVAGFLCGMIGTVRRELRLQPFD